MLFEQVTTSPMLTDQLKLDDIFKFIPTCLQVMGQAGKSDNLQ